MLTKINEKLAGKRLFVNCAADQTRIALFLDKEVVAEKIIESRSELSERLLAAIDQLIRENNFQIDSVSIFPGPGSYTGLRIGLTCANFFAWSLHVPIYETNVDGKIIGNKCDYILPVYLHTAHITKPKLRL